MPVEVVTLADVPIQDSSEYLAQLVSRTQVAIYPQVSGVVTSIFVKPGQTVREGAPLLQIDPRRESANLSNQVAAKAQREANLALAKRNASRSAALFREGLVSRHSSNKTRARPPWPRPRSMRRKPSSARSPRSSGTTGSPRPSTAPWATFRSSSETT